MSTDKSIRFIPFGEYILVKPGDPETMTKSGFLLTEGSAEKQNRGVVVALGRSNNPTTNGQPYVFTVEVGDIVYWSGYANEIEIDGEKFIVIKESQILGFEKSK